MPISLPMSLYWGRKPKDLDETFETEIRQLGVHILVCVFLFVNMPVLFVLSGTADFFMLINF